MMSKRKIARHWSAKPLVIAAALTPAFWLAWQFPDGLGFNPIETLNRETGDWALRFLILTLAVSPLAKVTRTADLIRFRRIIGLAAFGYAALHLSSYIILDQGLDWAAIWADVVKRNFITVGAVAALLLLPLAATSTDAMMRKLGAKRWRGLHRLTYPAAILACLHYFMMVKADTTEPLIYAAILSALLGHRIWSRNHTLPRASAKAIHT
ncbi:MAG: sulfite oxidase heme-binding subunit YedZ [Alphaproteobacteria bacterium]